MKMKASKVKSCWLGRKSTSFARAGGEKSGDEHPRKMWVTICKLKSNRFFFFTFLVFWGGNLDQSEEHKLFLTFSWKNCELGKLQFFFANWHHVLNKNRRRVPLKFAR